MSDTKEIRDFGIQILTIKYLTEHQAKRISELIINICERIKELETALVIIWPFIEEDFPKGTGDNHGTCASDLYLLAAREVEQALKGING